MVSSFVPNFRKINPEGETLPLINEHVTPGIRYTSGFRKYTSAILLLVLLAVACIVATSSFSDPDDGTSTSESTNTAVELASQPNYGNVCMKFSSHNQQLREADSYFGTLHHCLAQTELMYARLGSNEEFKVSLCSNLIGFEFCVTNLNETGNGTAQYVLDDAEVFGEMQRVALSAAFTAGSQLTRDIVEVEFGEYRVSMASRGGSELHTLAVDLHDAFLQLKDSAASIPTSVQVCGSGVSVAGVGEARYAQALSDMTDTLGDAETLRVQHAARTITVNVNINVNYYEAEGSDSSASTDADVDTLYATTNATSDTPLDTLTALDSPDISDTFPASSIMLDNVLKALGVSSDSGAGAGDSDIKEMVMQLLQGQTGTDSGLPTGASAGTGPVPGSDHTGGDAAGDNAPGSDAGGGEDTGGDAATDLLAELLQNMNDDSTLPAEGDSSNPLKEMIAKILSKLLQNKSSGSGAPVDNAHGDIGADGGPGADGDAGAGSDGGLSRSDTKDGPESPIPIQGGYISVKVCMQLEAKHAQAQVCREQTWLFEKSFMDGDVMSSAASMLRDLDTITDTMSTAADTITTVASTSSLSLDDTPSPCLTSEVRCSATSEGTATICRVSYQ
eukprot:TRINITY_DN16301_c0_g1::TRINITY_DN16301_c0_g1_i1::g.3190::m.3190 TRINITY_DN16301_c0_g1::TRINITY_DN16301_c0_g1_i1::g.3190  ORF type:complete len:618 (+),score=168.43,Pex19/PF04614.7/22,Pex19/PF04614.7/0.58 TRINITY_DN16301_c0_g1_i1:126-1979(+)